MSCRAQAPHLLARLSYLPDVFGRPLTRSAAITPLPGDKAQRAIPPDALLSRTGRYLAILEGGGGLRLLSTSRRYSEIPPSPATIERGDFAWAFSPDEQLFAWPRTMTACRW